MSAPQAFAILFTRLPRVENAPGLILLESTRPAGANHPTRVGTLTDAALRGRCPCGRATRLTVPTTIGG